MSAAMSKEEKPVYLPQTVYRSEPSKERVEDLKTRFGISNLKDLPPAAKKVANDPVYQPWRVTTNHRTSKFCLTDDAVRIWFVRAMEPVAATRMALESRKFLEEPYRPGLVMTDFTVAYGLDETEWAAYWKHVKNRLERYEVVPMVKDKLIMDARCKAAWETNKPVLFVYGDMEHPLFFSATDFNPDADDDRGEMSDIMNRRCE